MNVSGSIFIFSLLQFAWWAAIAQRFQWGTITQQTSVDFESRSHPYESWMTESTSVKIAAVHLISPTVQYTSPRPSSPTVECTTVCMIYAGCLLQTNVVAVVRARVWHKRSSCSVRLPRSHEARIVVQQGRHFDAVRALVCWLVGRSDERWPRWTHTGQICPHSTSVWRHLAFN